MLVDEQVDEQQASVLGQCLEHRDGDLGGDLSFSNLADPHSLYFHLIIDVLQVDEQQASVSDNALTDAIATLPTLTPGIFTYRVLQVDEH